MTDQVTPFRAYRNPISALSELSDQYWCLLDGKVLKDDNEKPLFAQLFCQEKEIAELEALFSPCVAMGKFEMVELIDPSMWLRYAYPGVR